MLSFLQLHYLYFIHINTYINAFYIATVGRAEVLRIDDKIGILKVGIESDPFGFLVGDKPSMIGQDI